VCQGTVLCHTSKIYIYLIESPPAVKKISLFQFFYILILIRQKVYKILLFKIKSPSPNAKGQELAESPALLVD